MSREQIPVTPGIITWARERAGLTREAAAVTFRRIAAWEAGEEFPTYPQLEKLADTFKVPVAVFFFPEPPDLPSIKETFRTLGSEQFDQIPPKIRLLLRKALTFQMSLAELSSGRNPAERLITRDLTFRPNTSIDTIAASVREYLIITLEQQFGWWDTEAALEHWRDAFLNVGVYVFKDQFRQDDFSGFCLYDDEFPIIYVNNTTAKARQIFTLFDELAHLLFHTSGIDKINDDYIEALPQDEKRIEIICNRLAARLLVPEDAFDQAFSGRPATEATAEELAALFKVSREFIFRKFLDRELITAADYTVAAERWAAQRKPGTGGDHYNTKIACLGKEYVSLAFSQYYQNRIDEAQLADYLDTKPQNLATLEDYMARRAS
jgi:Zn-dependent peptidase ImmA (M78 family)/transcriptional regulator with XRE-family HTH domain